jgi:hypothetical protein
MTITITIVKRKEDISKDIYLTYAIFLFTIYFQNNSITKSTQERNKAKKENQRIFALVVEFQTKTPNARTLVDDKRVICSLAFLYISKAFVDDCQTL